MHGGRRKYMPRGSSVRAADHVTCRTDIRAKWKMAAAKKAARCLRRC
jgi:hypothetical protein